MIKINYQIPKSTLEILMENLFAIIVDEIGYQVTNNFLQTVYVFVERHSAANDAECPMIKIELAAVKPTGTSANSFEEVEYMFAIEVVTTGSKSGSRSASYNSAILNQRLVSIIRYILNHPSYKRLGTNKVSSSGIKKMDIVDIDPMDTKNTPRDNVAKMRMTRIYYSVIAHEANLYPTSDNLVTEVDIRFIDATSETGYIIN